MKPAAVALCLSLVAVVYGEDPAPSAPSAPSVAVCGSAPDGSRAGGAALAAVAALVLNATGVRAHVSRAVPACPAPSLGTVQLLAAGALDVALVAVNASSALSVLELRDTDLEELGDAAPAWRRACLATRPPARSLLDLADPALAEHYRLGPDDLRTISQFTCETKNCTFTPEWCKDPSSTCATILTSDESEKAVLARVVLEQELRARVVALGPALGEAAAALARPALLCDRAPDLSPLRRLQATALGPPPCRPYSDCPFEPLRLVKVVNAGALTQSTRALKTLAQLSFTAEELIDLTVRARIDGPEKAAQAYITQNLHLITPSPEVRVAVLLPLNTSRHAYEASDFEIAAKLVEKEIDGSLVRDRLFKIELKVEMHNDYCSAPFAYKILTNALGTGEYGSLSAVAGPACGAAFGDVARQALTHVMPLLAFTPQAPPPPEVAWLVLLAAGDARLHNDLWATLLAAMNWSRLAVLSEVATRASLDIARLNLTDASHLELPDDGNVHEELISKWVKRAAEGNFKILYPYLEDAREVRAALCAGHAAGLRPRDGAVWLLPAALPAGWDSPDHLSCTPAHLDEMLEGHLRAVPAWEAEWPAAQRAAWAARCAGCVPRAALLYDALHMWAGALSRLLTADPFVHDNIHDPLKIRALIEDTISNEYVGLTGRFEWTLADGAHARSIPHVIQQWRNGTYEVVGRWDRGLLSLQPESLRWATDDGRIPDDGGEHCGLEPLAELLRADCRTAFIVLAALLLSALVGALAALALYCRRRAEREYRAHLEVLRMRTYGLKPGGLDRWEVPRERVVINRKLGTGAFGTVYGGHALLAEDRGWTAVAVKTLKAGATTEEKLDFLSEAEAMKRFDHKNVVRLLAVVTKTEPVCTVMEFMLYGDLKNYLLARRHLATESGISAGSDEAAEEVSPRRLTGMALDAARALSYLAQLRYVHRDVAARNCLVSANRVVKLADFGMTRLVFENDYYRFSRKGMLPVRWMAPESLALGVFSPASDVWSFGVLLYEIVTFGSLPFQGLSNSEVLGRVKAGHTLELPKGLKPQLEGLIKSCWQQEAKARPAAAAVAAFLADSPRLLAPCLDVPLDALPLDPDPPWRAARDRAEARWVSWAAPASAATDTTYLSADARPPSEHDAFLPLPPTP